MSDYIDDEVDLSEEDNLHVSEDELSEEGDLNEEDAGSFIDDEEQLSDEEAVTKVYHIDEELADDEDEEVDDEGEHMSDDELASDNAGQSGADDEDSNKVKQYDIFNPEKRLMKKIAKKVKKKQPQKNEFIEYEAELSEGEVVSEDELESSGDEQDDKELVADEDEEIASDDEERIRSLYHKQLDNEDRRQVLLLKEQLEEKEITATKRHKRFRWQMADDMDRLGKHDDMDDFEDGTGDDDDEGVQDDENEKMFAPRLRQPTDKYLFLDRELNTNSQSSINLYALDGEGTSSSAPIEHPKLNSLPNQQQQPHTSSDINKFLFRDRETVNALSATNSDHRLVARTTREEKDRIVEREIKRVLQSKSIFDKLFD